MELKDFLHGVEKDLGKSIIIRKEEKETFDVISTSSLSLDIATRVGGIPTKKITEVFGAEGSGKSTVALEVSKNLIQKFNRRVFYVDIENMMEHEYIESIFGFDYTDDDFVLAQPLTSEDALMLAEDAIKSGLFGLVILDSIGALIPEKEVKNPLDKDSYSGSSKLITRFVKRIIPFIRVNNVALIAINQVRDNVQGYGAGYTTPGGHAFKHAATLRIMLSTSSKIQDEGTVIGNNVKFVVKKNKVGSPFWGGEFPLLYGKGVDYIGDVINTAVKLGIILRKGSYYYYNDSLIGQGTVSVRDFLESSPDSLDSIVQECYNITNTTKGDVHD